MATPWENRLRGIMRLGHLRPADMCTLLDLAPATLHDWLWNSIQPLKLTWHDAALRGVLAACKDRRLPLDPTMTNVDMKGALIAIRNEYVFPDRVS